MLAGLSRREGEGPGGEDPTGLVWTPSGPEVPWAPGRQAGAQQGSCSASGPLDRGKHSKVGRDLVGRGLARGPFFEFSPPSPTRGLNSWVLMASLSPQSCTLAFKSKWWHFCKTKMEAGKEPNSSISQPGTCLL